MSRTKIGIYPRLSTLWRIEGEKREEGKEEEGGIDCRYLESHVAYAESHDQALVGDKTLAFWMMDKGKKGEGGRGRSTG